MAGCSDCVEGGVEGLGQRVWHQRVKTERAWQGTDIVGAECM